MRILIAPDKFKDCLTAPAVAEAIAAGLRRVDPSVDLDLCPLADGGEGTVDALVKATGGRLIAARVTGPLPHMKVDAIFGLLGDQQTAVIEMAAASGLMLLKPEDRNPLYTTTFGTGELLLAAAGLGVKQIILGIGGSATNDAGLGAAQAAGLTILLDDGEPVSMTEPLCGQDIDRVILVKRGRGSPIDAVKITVACDVSNPLVGPTGAAHVFGPQKGASPDVVQQLDQSLQQLATRLGKLNEANTPGAGAAGGLGFGMMAYFAATLRPGIEIVMEAVHLRERLKGADLCITGEGRLDASSLRGKTPIGVARLCKEMGVPCVVMAGSIDLEAKEAFREAFDGIISIKKGQMTAEESIRNAAILLSDSAASELGLFTIDLSNRRR